MQKRRRETDVENCCRVSVLFYRATLSNFINYFLYPHFSISVNTILHYHKIKRGEGQKGGRKRGKERGTRSVIVSKGVEMALRSSRLKILGRVLRGCAKTPIGSILVRDRSRRKLLSFST